MLHKGYCKWRDWRLGTLGNFQFYWSYNDMKTSVPHVTSYASSLKYLINVHVRLLTYESHKWPQKWPQMSSKLTSNSFKNDL